MTDRFKAGPSPVITGKLKSTRGNIMVNRIYFPYCADKRDNQRIAERFSWSDETARLRVGQACGDLPVFLPSAFVPTTGVFKAIHCRHRDSHYVLLLKGDNFPICATCQTDVRYCLEFSTTWAFEDSDLSAIDWSLAI